MFDIIQKGGAIVIILIVCSIISLTVFIERLWSLNRRRICPKAFGQKILALLEQQKYQEAALLCGENHTPLGRLLGTAATRAQNGQLADLETVLEEKGHQEVGAMSRDLEAIGAVATVAPLLGLLGTVTGMITVFQRIEAMGVGDPIVLASGIWEALITTAAGLIVAVPSFIFHKYLSVKVEKMTSEIEVFLRGAIDCLKNPGKNGDQP